MQSSEQDPNWNTSSFAATSNTGEGDSFSSFQSAITPGYTAVHQQSTEHASLDANTPVVAVSNDDKDENLGVSNDDKDENVGVDNDDKDENLGVSNDDNEENFGVNHDKDENVGVSNDDNEENLGVGNDDNEENLGVSHDNEENLGVSHDNEENLGVSNDNEENLGISNDENLVVSNDDNEENLGVINDNEENLGVSNDNEENLGVSNDDNEENMGVSNSGNDENLCISNDNVVKTNTESTSAINVFEEDARSSWSEEQKQTQFKETVVDESSQNSVSSHKSSTKKPCSDDDETKRDFPPENLFEYMWPQENGEFYILQEQICDYLNVKSFKRKYPDLVRRTVDMDEKRFLREKGVVTEMQCDLGLTALRSEEVLELMSKDYPGHYKEYIKVLREKEQQNITEKHKELAATSSDKNKMIDLVKKAMQSAAEYNAHLNQERREERKSCMDLQTFTIHYPVKPSKVKKYTKPGKYPVALLPGQFQDYYKGYTSKELKYLPVNTVLYGPLKELNTIKALSDGSQSDSDDSTASEGSCSSSQGTHDDSSSGSEKTDLNKKVTTMPDSPYQPKVKPNAVCKVCKTGPEGKIKEGKPEELLHCSECETSAHPSCIELTSDVVNVLKTYPWQCMDCKVCSHCRDPNDEDKMLFCDTCDRGYHTFCVGMKNLPLGKWICRQCGSCSVCGATKPGPESSKTQWQYDTIKGNEGDIKNIYPKILCQSCFKKKR